MLLYNICNISKFLLLERKINLGLWFCNEMFIIYKYLFLFKVNFWVKYFNSIFEFVL